MLAQQFINAISLGGVYALFAFGFTLVFGVLNVINLAHGAVFMLGGIFVAMLVTGVAGWILDKWIFTPLRARRAPHLAPMIATIGVAISLTSTIEGYFGTQNQRFPAELLPA